MYSNSSLRAIPLWDWHCLHIKANLLLGPSPTRYSTTLSIYPLSLGKTGRGKGGPGGGLFIRGVFMALDIGTIGGFEGLFVGVLFTSWFMKDWFGPEVGWPEVGWPEVGPERDGELGIPGLIWRFRSSMAAAETSCWVLFKSILLTVILGSSMDLDRWLVFNIWGLLISCKNKS